jgi:hypothetical protein
LRTWTTRNPTVGPPTAEIVIEADADQAEAAKAWLEQAMLDGMRDILAPVLVEVEVKVSQTWGAD